MSTKVVRQPEKRPTVGRCSDCKHGVFPRLWRSGKCMVHGTNIMPGDPICTAFMRKGGWRKNGKVLL